MKNIISFDKLLSVWIIFYFILFVLNVVEYNPLILIIISIIFQVISILYILYFKKNVINILVFLIVILMFKISMFIYIFLTKLLKITNNDIVFTILFIIIYILYITIQNESLYSIYNDLLLNYVNEKEGRTTNLHNMFKLYLM